MTIATQVDDEKEQSVSYDADLELNGTSATARYFDGESLSCIKVGKDEVCIERTGDYLFRLRLKEKERVPATLGVGGNVGEIFTYTDFIKYSITKNSLLLSMQYVLLFSGDEKQRMKIRLHARQDETLEEK